ncbi:hypothetical protein C8Q80DRAFT_831335 [Daedaleopsis nitida]|nr:hypothetical protein C8Q80DRAFT_831335 [Daedaleopsis nitida]
MLLRGFCPCYHNSDSGCAAQNAGDMSSSAPENFGPTFVVDEALPDLTLVTTDRYAFYVHRRILFSASQNLFGGLLQAQSSLIDVPESSAEMAIVLHVSYAIPCGHLTPSLATIEKAIRALFKYSIPVQAAAARDSPLYRLVLAHAPHAAIETYALAGHYHLEDIAVAASAHLLAYDTSQLSDELSVKMGSLYFKRLFDLHRTRHDALKRIVMRPPRMHPPKLTCSRAAQEQMTTNWAHVAAEFAWNTGGISTYGLQSSFEKAEKGVSCDECRSMLQVRIQEAMQEWSAVKRNI